MAIERKYNLFIKNDTLELVNLPNRTNVIIKKWCFKLKEDWFGHILKYKV